MNPAPRSPVSLVRWSARAVVTLLFTFAPAVPLHAQQAGFLAFPLPNSNPYSAKINSVFDHFMTVPYGSDKQVTAFNGETGRVECGRASDLPAFRAGASGICFDPDYPFVVVWGNYTGNPYLYYDNHPGYDYKTTDQASDGKIRVLAAAAGTTQTVGLTPATGGCSVSDLARWGAVIVFHDPPNDQYATCYLHLSDTTIVGDGVHVSRGQQIGVSGSTGLANNAPHLHFEVHKKRGDGSYVPVDPYGWEGLETDPYATLNGYPTDINVNLWDSSLFPLTITTLRANRSSLFPCCGPCIAFTVVAHGGTPPYQYKWVFFEDRFFDGGRWWIEQDWSSVVGLERCAFGVVGSVVFAVFVRSAGSSSDIPETGAAMHLTVQQFFATFTGLTADKSLPQASGTTIHFTATAIGGTAPYQYKWWVDDGTVWMPQGNWSSSATFAWTPTSANANYRIGVWVRSTGNTVEDVETGGSMAFPIQ